MANKTETRKIIEIAAQQNVFKIVGGEFQDGYMAAIENVLKILGVSDSTIFDIWFDARDWAAESCPGYGSKCVSGCHACAAWAAEYSREAN